VCNFKARSRSPPPVQASARAARRVAGRGRLYKGSKSGRSVFGGIFHVAAIRRRTHAMNISLKWRAKQISGPVSRVIFTGAHRRVNGDHLTRERAVHFRSALFPPSPAAHRTLAARYDRDRDRSVPIDETRRTIVDSSRSRFPLSRRCRARAKRSPSIVAWLRSIDHAPLTFKSRGNRRLTPLVFKSVAIDRVLFQEAASQD